MASDIERGAQSWRASEIIDFDNNICRKRFDESERTAIVANGRLWLQCGVNRLSDRTHFLEFLGISSCLTKTWICRTLGNYANGPFRGGRMKAAQRSTAIKKA